MVVVSTTGEVGVEEVSIPIRDKWSIYSKCSYSVFVCVKARRYSAFL